MLITLDINKTIRYKCKSDTLGEPTYFLLGVISKKNMISIQNIWGESTQGDLTYECVKKGLKGWENFKDSNNNNVEFKYNDDGCIEIIPFHILIELGAEILKLNVLSELDKKN